MLTLFTASSFSGASANSLSKTSFSTAHTHTQRERGREGGREGGREIGREGGRDQTQRAIDINTAVSSTHWLELELCRIERHKHKTEDAS